MLYMIIGRFRRGAAVDRSPSAGASQSTESPGVTHGSWVDATLRRSFQIVECDNLTALQQWAARWRHRVELEVVPVLSASDAVAALEPLVD